MESTYGDRDHESVDGARDRLAVDARDGGARWSRAHPGVRRRRTQEIVYDLHVLWRAGKIPAVPIVIDSPLATAATTVFEHNVDLFDQTEAPVREIEKLFRFENLSFTNNVDESKALNSRTDR